MKKYNLKNTNFLLNDKESRDYYLQNNNYLKNLQAIISLIEKEIHNSSDNPLIRSSLLNIIDELNYINKNYSLVKLKKKNNNKTPKGKEINQ